MKSTNKPRVLILGGGFGGLECAKRLKKAKCHVTLIDRNNHHLFQPLLYQVASAGLSMPEIAKPLRATVDVDKDLDILMDNVEAIDLEKKEVSLKTRKLEYDYLIIALGAVSGYFGNDHWAKYTVGLKSLEEAGTIRRNILHAYERAEICEDPEEQKKLMTTVVIGGGPTGVETAGAFSELARQVINKDFYHIDPVESRVILIEAAPKVLAQFPDPLPEKAKASLEKMGVDVRVNSPVKDITEKKVHLEDEVIEAENIIWGAGVQASPITKKLNIPVDRGGRILVEPDCSLPGYENVFAIGDIASLTDANNTKVPGVSPAAIQMGSHVSKLISQDIEGEGAKDKKREPFVYFDKGSMATIGRSSAIAQIGPLKIDGFVAWLLWLGVHLIFLVGFRNKVAVLLQWLYAYFTYQRGARIITGLTAK
ncbi:MAG: NAD(P)/FAD-dependent oxidoreductase [Verrucomicrobiota bacterium]